MRNRLFAVLAVVVVGVALAAPLAAQSLVLKATIPFEFNFSGKVMPAGEYLIQADGGSAALRLKNYESRVAAISLAFHPSGERRTAGEPTLTFNRYGDQYFLSNVWAGSTASGLEVPMTRAERELAKVASAQKYEILAVMAAGF